MLVARRHQFVEMQTAARSRRGLAEHPFWLCHCGTSCGMATPRYLALDSLPLVEPARVALGARSGQGNEPRPFLGRTSRLVAHWR